MDSKTTIKQLLTFKTKTNMDANKKLEILETEFNSTINHAAEVLEEYVNTMTEKILVDAFNELSVEDQMLVLLGMVCETQPEVEKTKPVFDFDFAVEHNLDYKTFGALQRLELESIFSSLR